jgi:undecaprenyl diphosphate synthase
LKKNNVKLAAIGDMSRLPEGARKRLEECIETTSGNTATTLTLALSYSARWELCEAVKKIVASGVKTEEIDDQMIEENLSTKGYPDPDLLIRTGGELRVSNFMLWQMAYTEFYFCDTLWPDFRKDDFYKALYEYQQRQRRYGRV